MTRTLLTALLAAAFAFGLADAHAFLIASTPENGGTVAIAPESVTLTLSEAVEVRFSVFKVYPLETDPDMTLRELVAAAEALVAEALPRQDDAELRVDTGTVGEGRTAEITLTLRDDLAPGTYLVMWRVLSVDTHTSEDYMVFSVAESDGGE